MTPVHKLFRYRRQPGEVGLGWIKPDGVVCDLTAAGPKAWTPLLETDDPFSELHELETKDLPELDWRTIRLLSPLEHQEVWAAGVTYQRSKTARMEESDFSANAYDRVYDAERPELFFKAASGKTVGHDDEVGIRKDSRWNVPEPELTLVLNSMGRVVGYTIGNDMSSRDIEGANLLYLPQAKVYLRSCAVGPWIVVGPSEVEAREWTIDLEIKRAEQVVFGGQTSVGQIKRPFEELAEFLFRCQSFPRGAALLTGTGVVPPNDFTLQPGDEVQIEISGIGVLKNKVLEV